MKIWILAQYDRQDKSPWGQRQQVVLKAKEPQQNPEHLASRTLTNESLLFKPGSL